VYGSARETLADAFLYMRRSSAYLNVQMNGFWYREYQVYPNRLHPLNNMSTACGVILSAIRVQEIEGPIPQQQEQLQTETVEDEPEAKRPKLK
jgi:hypothetical protein